MKVFNRFLLLLFMLVLQVVPMKAQWVQKELLSDPTLSVSEANKLTVKGEAIGFFKDNEYFNPIAEGQTLPGINLIPRASYQLDSLVRFELGFYNITFSGDNHLNKFASQSSLFYRIQYSPKPYMNLVLGNLYQGVNHRLIEPLYQWEKHYSTDAESGIQYIYDNKINFLDVWLNWRQFIRPGDDFPERLTFGVSSSLQVSQKQSDLQLTVPIQLTIYHEGGQINDYGSRMIVLGNLVSGLKSDYKISSSRFVKSVGLDMYLAYYYDKLPNEELRPARNGWGVYPVARLNADPINFLLGYWKAKNFFSPDGEPLFNSFSGLNSTNEFPNKDLITFKFIYSKQIHKHATIGAQVETYTDLGRKETDYSFGVHLRLMK